MSFTVIIPARMKSTRLPEKPLKDICGKPMIVRVAEAASRTGASRIAVATDHEAIYEACRTAGIECVMTRADHPTGTDRLAEAASLLGLAADEIVVNIQGDEPLMPAEAVNRFLRIVRNARLQPLPIRSRPLKTSLAPTSSKLSSTAAAMRSPSRAPLFPGRGTLSVKIRPSCPRASARSTIWGSTPTESVF